MPRIRDIWANPDQFGKVAEGGVKVAQIMVAEGPHMEPVQVDRPETQNLFRVGKGALEVAFLHQDRTPVCIAKGLAWSQANGRVAVLKSNFNLIHLQPNGAPVGECLSVRSIPFNGAVEVLQGFGGTTGGAESS